MGRIQTLLRGIAGSVDFLTLPNVGVCLHPYLDQARKDRAAGVPIGVTEAEALARFTTPFVEGSSLFAEAKLPARPTLVGQPVSDVNSARKSGG